MDIRSVTTAGAPKAIGPYSQAIVAGGLVFCSGQVALDPASGEPVPGDIPRPDRTGSRQSRRGARRRRVRPRPRGEDDGLPH